LCDPRRYQAFKQEVARFGFDHVRKCGFEQVRKVLSVPEDAPSRREPGRLASDSIKHALEAFVERNHTTPSERQTVAIIRQHYEPPPREVSASVGDEDPVAKAARLERQLAKVTRERDAALAKVAKLETLLASGKSLARKASGRVTAQHQGPL